MGFFRKGSSEKSGPVGITIVAEGTRLVGELTLQSRLHIDGVAEGSINSSADVSIGRGGSFNGSVVARRVIVSGSLKGTLHCELLDVAATGTVEAEVVTDELIVEPGGQFAGESRLRTMGDAIPALQFVGTDDRVLPAVVAESAQRRESEG